MSHASTALLTFTDVVRNYNDQVPDEYQLVAEEENAHRFVTEQPRKNYKITGPALVIETIALGLTRKGITPIIGTAGDRKTLEMPMADIAASFMIAELQKIFKQMLPSDRPR